RNVVLLRANRDRLRHHAGADEGEEGLVAVLASRIDDGDVEVRDGILQTRRHGDSTRTRSGDDDGLMKGHGSNPSACLGFRARVHSRLPARLRPKPRAKRRAKPGERCTSGARSAFASAMGPTGGGLTLALCARPSPALPTTARGTAARTPESRNPRRTSLRE